MRGEIIPIIISVGIHVATLTVKPLAVIKGH